MRANYGYMDGSGTYYVTIDTERCQGCEHQGCLGGCPKGIFEMVTDDWDDRVASVRQEFRKSLKYVCAECKPSGPRPELPCRAACGREGILHSW